MQQSADFCCWWWWWLYLLIYEKNKYIKNEGKISSLQHLTDSNIPLTNIVLQILYQKEKNLGATQIQK